MENHQGEIFYLYKVKKKSQDDLISILKDLHGVEVSKKQLTTQLGKWGYRKKVKKTQPSAALCEGTSQSGAGNSLELSISPDPGDARKVDGDDHGAIVLGSAAQNPSQDSNSTSEHLMWRSPPRFLREEQWRGSENIFYHIDKLIQGSFEAGYWRWNGREALIHSSNTQEGEKTLLHCFLNNLACANHAVDEGNLVLARLCWAEGFENVDRLVQGQYHDIIPNMIQKINDLNDEGQEQLALQLQRHITACAQTYLKDNHRAFSIYNSLAQIQIVHMPALEARIMSRFKELFEWYQGPRNYNSFVMMMNQARRRLVRDEWVRLEDVLPPVDHYDQVFGLCDRRSLDVISLRIEIAYKRAWFHLVETEASILIQRAELIHDDEWQRLYNLVRGWYNLGCAQFFLLKWDPATISFNNALASDNQLRELGDWNIFDSERRAMERFQTQMQR